MELPEDLNLDQDDEAGDDEESEGHGESYHATKKASGLEYNCKRSL